MERTTNTSIFLRDMFALFSLTGLFFLLRHPDKRGRLFILILVVTLVSTVLFICFRTGKKALNFQPRIKLPKDPFFILSLLAVVLLIVLFYYSPDGLLSSIELRLFLLAALAGLLGLFCALTKIDLEPHNVMFAVLLTGGLTYRIIPYLTTIQSTPFSLGWSEGSQVYFASLFHSQSIYGQKLPLPVLDPSRYLIQSLPFLFGIRSILIHRLWQVVLWFGLNAAGAWLVAKKFGKKLALGSFWLSAFIFLFFFQGPIYYSLFVSVIIVLLGYKKDNPLRTLIFVLLASVWAGLSRVNWIPLPGLLAVSLYLFDEPFDGKNWLNYMKMTVVWTVIGVVVAFAAKNAYRYLSGENPDIFDSAFSSPLLWNRMFPNATYPPGILLGITLVCLPLLILTILFVKNSYKKSVHWLRWAGLVGILLAFFVGGIVVSAKIGGGSNLHNLDAFLVFYIAILLGVLSGRLAPELGAEEIAPLQVNRVTGLLLLVVLTPVFYTFIEASASPIQNTAIAEAEVVQMQQMLDKMDDIPGEVLFITERQLLTIGAINGVSVVPEYEKVMIMEMAMADNWDYLERYYQLLYEHNFKAIFLDTVNTTIQDSKAAFAEENNSYVKKVVIPTLEEYKPIMSWNNGAVVLLVPIGTDGVPQILQKNP